MDELHFDDPVEVIGQGSFGVVWLAEYRGTKVAIKRAVKTRNKSKHSRRSGSGGRTQHTEGQSLTMDSSMPSVPVSDDDVASGEEDVENQASSGAASTSTGSKASSHPSKSGSGSGSNQRTARTGSRDRSGHHFSLGFLADEYGHFSRHWYKPFTKKRGYRSRFRDSILGDSLSASLRTKTWKARLCPWFDEQSRREAEFLMEMRVLARLRHPCITTVMGAVVTATHDPMLVMEYMDVSVILAPLASSPRQASF